MMDHSFYRDRISAYFDGELSPEEHHALEEHLKDCRECQQLLEELSRLDQLVTKHRGLADDGYWEESAQKIQDRLELEEAERPVTDIRSGWRGMAWKLAAAAASIAVLTFVGLHKDQIFQLVSDEAPRVIIKTVDLSETDVVVEREKERQNAPGETVTGKTDEKTAVYSVSMPTERYVTDESLAYPTPEEFAGTLQMMGLELAASDYQPDTVAKKRLDRLPTPAATAPAVRGESAADQDIAISAGQAVAVSAQGDIIDRLADSQEQAVHEGRAATATRSLNLENWRKKRDSLVKVLADLPQYTATSDAKVSVGKSAVGRRDTDKQLLRRQTESALLTVVYQVALLTPDEKERETAVSFLREYANSENDIIRALAERYLDRLGSQTD